MPHHEVLAILSLHMEPVHRPKDMRLVLLRFVGGWNYSSQHTSRDSAWRASVRATRTISALLSSLASAAARILATASPLETTRLPLTCPQDFGAAWRHTTAALMRSRTGSNDFVKSGNTAQRLLRGQNLHDLHFHGCELQLQIQVPGPQ